MQADNDWMGLNLYMCEFSWFREERIPCHLFPLEVSTSRRLCIRSVQQISIT